MLVTFKCKVYGDIIMFGDVAISLIKMMGHSGIVPGAILAKDISAALDKLKIALKYHQEYNYIENNNEEDEEEIIVSLRKRALPLIELLTVASKEYDVMWQ